MEQWPTFQFDIEQEKWLPHFSCLFFVFGCVTAGWGNRDLLIVAASCFVLASSMWLIQKQKWFVLSCFLAAAGLGLCWTDSLLLHPYWGLLLAILSAASGSHSSVPLLAATAFMLAIANYFDSVCWCFQPAFLFLATLAVYLLGLTRASGCDSRLCSRMVTTTAVLSAFVASLGMFGQSYGIRPVELVLSSGEPFHFGGTASRIVGDHAASMEIVVPDLDSHSGATPSPARQSPPPRLVLLEHDSRSPLHAGRNLHQLLPWGAHTFFGNQYLAAAVERDGVLATNLGGSLSRGAGSAILMGCAFRHSRRIEPLIARHGEQVILSDSDLFSDKLSAYNPALIRELTGNNRYMRAVSLAFSLAAVVFAMAPKPSAMVAALLTAIAAAAISHLPDVGDVRLCCETGSPHDESVAFALLRAINESGLRAIRGDRGCRILCVGSGHKARWSGEKIVILEPRSECLIGTSLVSCDNVPLGNLSDVVNAMQLRVNHTSCPGKAEVNGVLVLGTGSPAKQDFKRWWSTAP